MVLELEVMVRYSGLYANARRGKVRKRAISPSSRAWSGRIRKVYEVDPLMCPRCGKLAGLMTFMSAGG